MNKKLNIILVGMPGAGKTFIGEKIAKKLEDYTFVDTDKLIEQRLNMSVIDIFEKQGEAAFREEESLVIEEITQNKTAQVIAVGGGAFNIKNINILKQSGVVFYLKTPINLLYERIKNEETRPMFLNTEDIKLKIHKLLEEREHNFEKANLTIREEEFETDDLVNFIINKFYELKDCVDLLPYPVFVDLENIENLQQKIKEYTKGKYAIIIDKNVDKRYGKYFQDAPKFVLKSGEKEKNIKNYEKIIEFATKNKIERGDTLVSIGGGVTSDITGFAASTYLRGVHLINIPTTLLADVDAAIGGKTGINTNQGKNLIGAFYQPDAVFCNLNFLQTLDNKQFKTGLAEILKYAFIENSCKAQKDFNLFSYLERNTDKILQRDRETLEEIIRCCIYLKESVVMKDEKENGLRQILNFGHTYGHALEKLSKFKLTHGEAVAQGIVFAFELAITKRLVNKKYYLRSIELLKKYDLYKPVGKINNKVIDLIEHDKKMKDGKINFVLPFYQNTVEIMKMDTKSLMLPY